MFFAGLLVGLGIMIIVIIKGPNQVIADQWSAETEEKVIFATLLHEQKYDDLNLLLEKDMVASLDGLKAFGYTNELQSSAKLIRGYYDLPGTKTPSQLDAYLSGIKGTDVSRLASAVVDFNRHH
jgi:hypothetical protein